MEIKSELKSSYQSIKLVFQNKRYILLALSLSVIFYLINSLILQHRNLDLTNYKELIPFLTTGIYYLLTRFSFYSLILISILTGILVSLIVFKRVGSIQNSKKLNVLTTIGIILGILVPGCASCGIGLVAILGLSASLFYLPFKGTEISVLAIILLFYAIIKTSSNLNNCNIQINIKPK